MFTNNDLGIDNFDWGEVYDPTLFIGREIFLEKVYDYWVSVKEGDTVVDIGSSVGPFAYKSLMNKAKKVYCIEPSRPLIQTNIKNNSRFFIDQSESPVTFLNYAVTDETKNEIEDSSDLGVKIYGEDKQCKTITFGDLIKNYNIGRIDFLKIDCEGGEYSILKEEYLDYIQSNVAFIACEVHSRNIDKGIEKFLDLKNNFLSKIDSQNYKIMCNVDNAYTDVTEWIFSDHGMNYILSSTEVMLYIKNNI